jgi:hypothetical protein
MIDQLYQNVVDNTGADVPGWQAATLTAQLSKEEQDRREALTADDIGGFTPTAENTLVSYRQERPAPDGLSVVNWLHDGLDHYGTVVNSVKIGGDRNTNPTTPKAYGIRKFVRGIVIHETTNWNRVGAGVDPETNYAYSVHFTISPAGTAYQHNDIAQIMEHATRANDTTVGIEITNISLFDKNARNAPAKTPSGATGRLHSEQTMGDLEEHVSEDRERIPAAWVSGVAGNLLYTFPPIAQMEAVSRLVHWLCGGTERDSRAAYLDMREQSVWPPFFTATIGGNTRELFMMHNNPRWTDAKFNDFEGIYAHTNIQSNRSDGSVFVLYCWLRLFIGMSDTDAYALTRALITDATLVKTNVPYLTNKVVAIDVTGKIPARGIPV